ncbi:hypothetical protein Hamer_G005881 [Homarus americanus]|uniref:Uncharacterized protein n=1 Tax=Homarus americanus TaxID=6706 RepID=A0A8J5MN20_HOMAM|nr:hypothetical protein Hamer_G005881 [Homarus americanus]
MSPAIHPVAEPPTFAIPTVMKYKIPKETEFNHAYEVVVALELEYKNIKFSVKPNLVGDLILSSQDHNTVKVPQRGHQPQRKDGQDNTIRPRGENNQNGPTTISSGTTCRSNHKTSKSDQGRALCYESGQSTDKARASVHQRDSPGGDATKKVRCGICSQSHKTEMCIKNHKEGTTTTTKCPNCGKKHYTWSTSCPERKKLIKVAMAKIQPQNTTEAPQSTFVWGQQRQKTVNPTPNAPQLSKGFLPYTSPIRVQDKIEDTGTKSVNAGNHDKSVDSTTAAPELYSSKSTEHSSIGGEHHIA